MPKSVDFNELELKLAQNFSVNTFSEDSITTMDGRSEIIRKLSELLKEELKLIQGLCLQFLDIFHLEGGHLTFSIGTNNAKPILTKTYRYPHLHREDVKTQVPKMLDHNRSRPFNSLRSSLVWVVPKKLDVIIR